MEHMTLEAKPRPENESKGAVKRRRREGQIPANLFGRGMETRLVVLEARDLVRVLQSDAGVNTLIDLNIEGQRHLVKLTNVEMEPVTRTFRHIGLHKLATGETTKATIPIELIGEPDTVSTGVAVLEPNLNAVEVRCLPEKLIASLPLDVSDMQIGDVKHVSDLSFPEGVEVLTQTDLPIVSLHVSRQSVAEAQEAADAASAEASPSPDAAAAASNE